jgi:GT2 family glycosyltransferase
LSGDPSGHGDLPSVAVVVAALDAAETLGDCLDSLLALRYPRERLEIVVVDNGSRDRTRDVAVSRPVTLLEEARRGPAAARNAGIRATKSAVVALTDADCTVAEEWLAALVAPLADPRVGIAGGRILARRPASAIELYGETIHDHRSAIESYRPPYVITMSWAARRELIDAIGPFEESLLRGSDVDWSYRAGRAGHAFAFCPDAVVFHRNESSLAGLAREGFTHGYHGVAVARRHAEYVAGSLAEADERRFGATTPSTATVPLAYDAVFRLAKRLGRVSGRLAGSRARTPDPC